jgi:hypothetical protein
MTRSILLALATMFLLAADDAQEADVPPLNKKVLAFADMNLGKKVDNGECAMLAVRALQSAGADPSSYDLSQPDYVWGKLVRTLTAETNLTGETKPGDVLQFHDAVFKWQVRQPGGKALFEAAYPHHTAIVAEVKKGGAVLEVLHQNTGDPEQTDEERRKVQKRTIRFSELQKGGWVKIYRPLP